MKTRVLRWMGIWLTAGAVAMGCNDIEVAALDEAADQLEDAIDSVTSPTDTTNTTADPTVPATLPQLGDAQITINEDATLSGSLLTDDLEDLEVAFVVVDAPANGSVNLNSNGSFVYSPDADYNGADAFVYAVELGEQRSADLTVWLTIQPVNDAPVFVTAGNVGRLEDSGLVTISGYAADITVGPADEAAQTLTFTVTTDTQSLFAAPPTLDADGTLTYVPVADAHGSALVYIRAWDDGGTADGGRNVSPAQIFALTVSSVNDAPAFNYGASFDRLEDSGFEAIAAFVSAISKGPANEAAQTVTFQVNNNAPHLFSSPPAVDSSGQLTYTLAADENGDATISITAWDDGGTAFGGSNASTLAQFTLSVTAVNDAPIFTNPVMTTNCLGGGGFSYTPTVYDADGDPNLTISQVANTCPFGIATTDIVRNTSKCTNITSSCEVELEVSDGSEASTMVLSLLRNNIRFVGPTPTGNADGSNWSHVTDSIQDAIDDVVAEWGHGDVWVKSGNYSPDGAGNFLALKSNVNVYGGFSGTEASVADREFNWVVSASVLLGDLNNSGVADAGDVRVMSMQSSTNTTVDGFVVMLGYGAGGGGLYCSGARDIRLNNMIFRGNYSTGSVGGGAIYTTSDCNLTADNLHLIDNTTQGEGGALRAYLAGRTRISRAIVTDNKALGTGSAFSIGYGDGASIFDSVFRDNTSGWAPALNVWGSNSTPITVANTVFRDNHSSNGFRGAVMTQQVVATFVGNTFINNTGANNGGALWFFMTNMTHNNNLYWNNTANAIYNWSGNTYTSSDNCLETMSGADPVETLDSGQVTLKSGSPCIDLGNAGLLDPAWTDNGEDWRNRTTRTDTLVLDGNGGDDPDTGYHLDPASSWISTFDVDSTTASWSVGPNVGLCHLLDDDNMPITAIGAGQLPTGSVNHGQTSGASLTLICEQAHVSLPAMAIADVP